MNTANVLFKKRNLIGLISKSIALKERKELHQAKKDGAFSPLLYGKRIIENMFKTCKNSTKIMLTFVIKQYY